MAIDTGVPIEERGTEITDSPAAQPRGREGEISLLDILIELARRKRLVLRITVICGILGLLISLILPKRYTAVSTVLPPQKSSSLGSILAAQLGSVGELAALAGGGQSFLKNPNDLYVGMMQSQTVEDATIRRFDLMHEYKAKYLSSARKSFERNFEVKGDEKDGLLHISVEDKDPKRAAEMANGWVEEFRKLSQTLAISEASQRRVFFEDQLEQAKNNLADAEEALKITQQKTGMIQLDSQARALIESAATLRAQIVAKEVQLQAMRTYATSENSNVVETQQELNSLQAQLAKLGGSGDVSSAGLILPKGKVPEVGLEYVRKLRDVKYRETLFEILARQYELAKLDEAKEGSIIQVVDPALPPDRKSFPHRALITLAAAFLGLFVGIFVAVMQAGFERLRQNPETDGKLSFLREAMGLKRSRAS